MNKNEIAILLVFEPTEKMVRKYLPIFVEGATLKAFGPKGEGLWGGSEKELTFEVESAEVGYVGDPEDRFASLNVYLKGYSAEDNGLIYTDKNFIKHIKALFPPNIEIDYSEQGMQGDDYVNFDVSY